LKNFTSFTILVVFLFIELPSHAMINPKYKEVMQRGYQMKGDSVVFPDSSMCLIDDFNAGSCGQQWKTSDYCIPQGGPVWDEGKCCEGLEAYLPEDMAGQATCQPIIVRKIDDVEENSGVTTTMFYFFFGLAIVFTGFILFAIYSKYKK
jgi:hypothetical protein